MLAHVSREPTLAVDMSPCRAVVMSAVSVDNGDRHTGQHLTFADICRVVLTARWFHPSDKVLNHWKKLSTWKQSCLRNNGLADKVSVS